MRRKAKIIYLAPNSSKKKNQKEQSNQAKTLLDHRRKNTKEDKKEGKNILMDSEKLKKPKKVENINE